MKTAQQWNTSRNCSKLNLSHIISKFCMFTWMKYRILSSVYDLPTYIKIHGGSLLNFLGSYFVALQFKKKVSKSFWISITSQNFRVVQMVSVASTLEVLAVAMFVSIIEGN